MKPILFSTEQVQAILDGRKTITRRVIKPQPPVEAVYSYISEELISKKLTEHFVTFADSTGKTLSPQVMLPYQPGDILWVRETFCEVPYEYNHIPIKGGYITTPKYAYKADSKRDYTGIWKPSIHMPKEAARIFLRVTDVRVERVQDIWMWVIEFERTEVESWKPVPCRQD